LAHKAARLQALKPGAAVVVERIIDALLVEAEGRKLCHLTFVVASFALV
jgi:hypothetical protein